MQRAYIAAALRQSATEYLPESRQFYAAIPACPGVWAVAENRADLDRELEEVLTEWIALGQRLGHDLPVIDGIDLSSESA